MKYVLLLLTLFITTMVLGQTETRSFYRAVNINGNTQFIDGLAYIASSEATNLELIGNTLYKQDIPLIPDTDAARAEMIRSSIWGNGGTVGVKFLAVPNGTYDVYTYAWEDNDPETISFLLNGSVVEADYNSGFGGSWQKLGPWRVVVSNGELELSTAGGYANISGIEVHEVIQTAACAGSGSITLEKFQGINNSTDPSVLNGRVADDVSLIQSFYAPENVSDDFGQRISGTICAPESGNYTLYIAGDDQVALYLSSDENPANKVRIAYHDGWTTAFEYDKYDTQDAVVTLEAGKKYYIEALHVDQQWEDSLTVAWTRPSQSHIEVIPGDFLSPNPNVPGTTTPPPAPSCSGDGSITLEKFQGINNSTDPSVLNGRVADEVSLIQSFYAPENVSDDFGQRISGTICAPESGEYTLYIAGDDQVALYLSSDENPANKVRIAYHDGWTTPFEYDKYDTQDAVVTLEAGKKYYIEALHVDQLWEDSLTVAWKRPGQSTIEVIGGEHLSPNPNLTVTDPTDPTPGPGDTTGEDTFDPDSISYDGPYVIEVGGTYDGKHWQSTDSNVPAVEIRTQDQVIIKNSVIRGAGYLIKSWGPNTNVIIENTRGYGLPHTGSNDPDDKIPRRFLTTSDFSNVVVKNCYMENTAGIGIADNYVGDGSPEQTIKILYNKVKNIDGRVLNGDDLVNFVGFNFRNEIPHAEIAWNQVINEAGNSFVEDNINIFNSKGTFDNPIRIHNNYIQGAYPLLHHDHYSGGGIITDTDWENPATFPANVNIYENQVISTVNYSFGVAGGHNIKVYDNRAVTSSWLPDGRLMIDVFSYLHSLYGINSNGYWMDDYVKMDKTKDNQIYNNLVGASPWNNGERHDGQLTAYDPEHGTMGNFIQIQGEATQDGSLGSVRKVEDQDAEFIFWQNKLNANNISLGPQ